VEISGSNRYKDTFIFTENFPLSFRRICGRYYLIVHDDILLYNLYLSTSYYKLSVSCRLLDKCRWKLLPAVEHQFSIFIYNIGYKPHKFLSRNYVSNYGLYFANTVTLRFNGLTGRKGCPLSPTSGITDWRAVHEITPYVTYPIHAIYIEKRVWFHKSFYTIFLF
jgi:hypothetical protein